MANKVKGERVLKAGGKEYIIYFDMNALAELEDHLGMTVVQVSEMMQDSKNLGIKFMRSLLWAGLLARQEGLTVEDAGRIMSEAESFAHVVQLTAEAFAAVFAGDVEAAKKKGLPAMKLAAGTGTK